MLVVAVAERHVSYVLRKLLNTLATAWSLRDALSLRCYTHARDNLAVAHADGLELARPLEAHLATR